MPATLNLMGILPELVVAVGAMFLLIFGVFQRADATRTIYDNLGVRDSAALRAG